MPAPPVKSSESPAPLVAQNDHDAATATMMDKTEQEQENLAAELSVDMEKAAAKDMPKVETEPRNDSLHTVKASKKGIEVVATRAGFIHSSRKVEGDRFTIQSMAEFGEWMELVNPKAEAQRKAEAKAAKLKASAVKETEEDSAD